MEVVILQVFVSLSLVAGALILFGFTVRQRDTDHADRLALAPLEDDTVGAPRHVSETATRGPDGDLTLRPVQPLEPVESVR